MIPLTVLLARSRGFCAGVERAVRAVQDTLAAAGRPVYVRHEIVHNRRVVETLEAAGARFVEEVEEIPDGAVAMFSAHGVAQKVEREAAARGLPVVDATCPLVRRVHMEGQKHAKVGREIVLIGHRGHVEVEGTLGRIDGTVSVIESVEEAERFEPRDREALAYVTQTTLSVDDTKAIIATLKERFPAIVGPDTRTICYATQNRQTAVRDMAERAEKIIVCGAHNSSNANRLREVAESIGRPALLVAQAEDLPEDFIGKARIVGLTAAASTPEAIVTEVLARLSLWRAVSVEDVGAAEDYVKFASVDLSAVGGSRTF